MDKDIHEPLTPSPDPVSPSEPPTTDSAQAAKANTNGRIARPGFRGSTLKGKLRTIGTFCKEAWDEHDLWVEALAVKGGASAIVIAGVVAVSSVVALPFVAAAGVIAGCGALVGIGVYGCAAGGAKAWESIRGVYARVMGREPPVKVQKERKDIIERLAEMKYIKKMVDHPIAQKVFNSRAWKQTQKFTKRREDSILHGMAVGGALVTLVLGVTVLATQVLVLPVIAVGTLATWAVAEVAVCFASGIYGLYLSGQSILKKHRQKKAAKLATMEKPLNLGGLKPAAPVPTKDMPKEMPAAEKPALTETFAEKAQAGNDNIPVPANDVKKPDPDPVAVPAAKRPGAPKP